MHSFSKTPTTIPHHYKNITVRHQSACNYYYYYKTRPAGCSSRFYYNFVRRDFFGKSYSPPLTFPTGFIKIFSKSVRPKRTFSPGCIMYTSCELRPCPPLHRTLVFLLLCFSVSQKEIISQVCKRP